MNITPLRNYVMLRSASKVFKTAIAYIQSKLNLEFPFHVSLEKGRDSLDLNICFEI